MIMSKTVYLTLLFVSLAFSLVFAYYISVNTFFQDKALFNVYLEGESVAFKRREEIEAQHLAPAYSELPPSITLLLDGQEMNLPAKELLSGYSSKQLVAYGKGNNIIKVLWEGATLLDKQNFYPLYEVKVSEIRTLLEQSFVSADTGAVAGQFDCLSDLPLDQVTLNDAVSKQVNEKHAVIVLSIEDVISSKDISRYNLCKKVMQESANIRNAFNEIKGAEDLTASDVFDYAVFGTSVVWSIKDPDLIKKVLADYKIANDIDPFPGTFDTNGDIVYLFEYPSAGEALDIERTLGNLEKWLKYPSPDFPLVIENLDPITYNKDQQVYDFTTLYAEGKTRIDILRNGVANNRVFNAQFGIEEVDRVVILPQEEFSFLSELHIGPDGKTEKGYFVGNGICNATTTIFRAAIHAGFPITERSGHTFYVPSYEWSGDAVYDLNIVDATFWNGGGTKVDLKFVNDLPYPVMLRSEISRDASNYQYHTIRVLTDPRAGKRTVELTDWKKWNVRGNRLYSASFTRNVFEKDQLVRSDTFTSHFTSLY